MRQLINCILRFFGHTFYNPREDPTVQRVRALEFRVDRLEKDVQSFRPQDLFVR